MTMFSDSEWDLVARIKRLTPRETQVLKGVFVEHTDDAIAFELGIATRTVRAHLGKIYRKCECRTRCGAAVCVFKTLWNHGPPPPNFTNRHE